MLGRVFKNLPRGNNLIQTSQRMFNYRQSSRFDIENEEWYQRRTRQQIEIDENPDLDKETKDLIEITRDPVIMNNLAFDCN